MYKNLFFYFIVSCTVFFTLAVKAQHFENSINFFGTNFPQEKIHIHFDKESYLPGETIWFKAYLFEENLPSEKSTSFYAAYNKIKKEIFIHRVIVLKIKVLKYSY